MGENMKKGMTNKIEQRGYHPPAPYQLDLEVFTFSDLRQRVGKDHLRRPHRIEFFLLIFLTRGECTHVVDFKPVQCVPGSLLVLRPYQIEQFDLEHDWDGWMMLFPPEFLLPQKEIKKVGDWKIGEEIERLPEYSSLQEHECHLLVDAMAQMQCDSKIEALREHVHDLLRYQLYAFLSRLVIIQERQKAQRQVTPLGLQRFKSFQHVLEKNYAKYHQVLEYARVLRCSEKSLTRSTMEAAGMSAKSFVASRIVLEAKRLLTHTSLKVTQIAESLGYDETTNFVKFFKREAGCTPGEFRRNQGLGWKTNAITSFGVK